MLACLPSALIDFALPQWKSEPNVRIEDAYKWIYQATRGGEHAVPSREMAEKYLNEEWMTLTDSPTDEPLWQPLCTDESIGRLNLRPFRAKGGKIGDLVEAFIKSSESFKGSDADFLAAWNELGKRLKSRSEGALNHREWKRLDEKMKKQKYPAIHHSREYENALHPAYRILRGEIGRRLINEH